MSFNEDNGIDGEWDFATKKKQEWVRIDDCEATRQTDKALLVKDGRGNLRWVHISQIHHESGVKAAGDTGSLMISRWFFDRWDEAKPPKAKEPPVEIPGCVCLGEARSGKAIKVRLPDGREEWFPVTQIEKDSDVRHDSDSGVLRVSAWIAKEKGISGKKAEPKAKPDEDDNIPF